MKFYEELSAEYDVMTQFEARYEKEKGFFEDLVKEYSLRKVLDAGCGTGFHSLFLAKLGLEVTCTPSEQLTDRQIHFRHPFRIASCFYISFKNGNSETSRNPSGRSLKKSRLAASGRADEIKHAYLLAGQQVTSLLRPLFILPHQVLVHLNRRITHDRF